MAVITQAMSRITDYLGPILALLAVLAAIMEALNKTMKPISGMIKWLRRRFGSDVENKIDHLSNSIGEVKGLVADLTSENERQNAKLDSLKSKVIENEKDRLSDSIFRLGFYARQGQQISDREFMQLQDNFTKYHDLLGGNGRVAEEYNFIRDYFNNKGWVKPKPASARQRKEKTS